MSNQKIQIHEKIISVEWGDMDALRHVNHARFFDYFQQARIDWLESMSLGIRKDNGPVVIHVACTYLKTVIYPATLILKSALHSLGRSSMLIDHLLYQDEQLMTEGLCKIVWVDYHTNQSMPLPAEIRALFS